MSRLRRITLADANAGADGVAVAVESDDPAAAAWIEEWGDGWFAPAAGRCDWTLRCESAHDTYERRRSMRPSATMARALLAFDTSVLELPTWLDGGRVVVDDAERSCLLTCAPGEIALLASSTTLRWRFTAILLLLEIVATRMRRSSLDLHAAGVATSAGSSQRGLLLVGPKGAGKTTLLLHLLRRGRWRWMANDRAFVREDASAELVLRGVPSVVKIRAGTLTSFPELLRGVENIERPYLLSLAELGAAASPANEGSERRPEGRGTPDLALSPPQIRRALAVEPCASAPLGAIVFPRVEPAREGWALEPLSSAESRARLAACRFGVACEGRASTLIEDLDGAPPRHSVGRIDRLSRGIPAYSLGLGRNAYVGGGLADRLEEIAVMRGRV